MSLCIVDTSVWVQAFRAPNSVEKAEVERLIKSGQAAMVGIVATELLRGARDRREFEALEGRLGALPFLELSRNGWQAAGRLLFELRHQGLTVPLPDAIIAAMALEGGHEVYTLDDHFRRVPGLRLHEANPARDEV
ncbi:MAG: PIN domain-containing protein [Dehalococcoidia bacterium]|nr:PIN domain-containing protein [Dehalococcoidia bacterium]